MASEFSSNPREAIKNMKQILRRIKRTVESWWKQRKAWLEAKKAFNYDWKQFKNHAGALHLERQSAAVAEIIMGYHVIEKGLTMPHRRLGFGRGAVVHLVNLIMAFERRYGKNDSQVTHAIGVLRAYRELHKDFGEPIGQLEEFLKEHGNVPAAVEPHVTKDEFYSAREAAFPMFAESRHVVRHFAGEVPRKTLEEAVELALTAPSACNRQHARIHIVDNRELMDKVFALQGGTRGFGQDADKMIVVSADLSAVRWGWERHDVYINGGIFVMNLCYALHYKGIAHCILHWSVSPENDMQAHRILNIPENEAIVQILACGIAPDEFDVAASPRRNLNEMMTWHS